MAATGDSIPATMRAVVLRGHGGLDQLEYRDDWPVPRPGPEEVLIRVGACGLNNTDVNTRTGWYAKAVRGPTRGEACADAEVPDPAWGGGAISFPRIQGADAVGCVVECGPGADSALLGRRVMVDGWLRDWSDPLNRDRTGYFGSERDGGFAEYCTVHQRNAGVIRSALSDSELATFSCSYTTAEGMLVRAGVREGEWVLVTGASGGVGSALVQLARRRGARVAAMASADKHAALAELAPDVLLPRDPVDLAAALREASGRSSVQVVADVVGGTGFGALIDALERGGRYVVSGAIAGPVVELDLRTLYLRDLALFGSTVLPPGIFQNVVGYIERGEVRPFLAAVYPLEEIHAAQKAFVSKRHAGKIVIAL